jgi:hypothetical protein
MADGTQRDARSGWKSYQVLERDAAGNWREPVMAALNFHRPQAQPAVAKMQKVEEIGWPEARAQMFVAGKKRKKAIVRPDKKEPIIWELKCTPHAWRVFFYIFESTTDVADKRIIYLHASYKTTTGQDYGEVAIARSRRGPSTGHPPTWEFEFPG